jgi:hypothetical protein
MIVAIPAILAVVVVVAGVLASMPVNKASTVHSMIQATIIPKIFVAGPDNDIENGETYTLSCNSDYAVVGLTLDLGPGTYTDDMFDVTIGGDDIITGSGIAEGAITLLDGVIEAARADEDLLIIAALSVDDGDENIEKARASVITTGTCIFTGFE